MKRAFFVVPAVLISAMASFAGEARAFDQTYRSKVQMAEAMQRTGRTPASYRIVTDETTLPPAIDAKDRYFGGVARVIYVDGRAVKLPETVIVKNIKHGHFVPVYSDSGAPLSQDDWLASLPAWLAMPTADGR